MAPQWYALRSKPNREEALCREAAARGFETHYPRVRVKAANPRARRQRPYFPGYLFVRAEMETVGCSVFSWIPYSNGLVLFGTQPASVPDFLLNAIRRRVGSVDVRAASSPGELHRGVEVSIGAGLLEGCEAVFDRRLSGNERVRVLLHLLDNPGIPLELPSWQISAKTRH